MNFTFKRVGFEWAVYDAESNDRLGTVRANGSRIRERSWDYRGNGIEGRSGSRKNAAEALARIAKKEANPSVVVEGDDTGLANLAEAVPSAVATITREGNGRHRAGRVYHLQVNGKHFGTYETRSQAVDAAIAAGAVI